MGSSVSLAGDAGSLSLRGEAERLLDLLFERLRERLADLCTAFCPLHSAAAPTAYHTALKHHCCTHARLIRDESAHLERERDRE
jgi:hypothetical protein